MKKLFLRCLALVLFVSLCAIDTAAQTTVRFEGIDYKLHEGTNPYAEVYDCALTDAKIYIPESVEYNGVAYKVVKIGQGAFSGCSNIEVIFPTTLNQLHSNSFGDGLENMSAKVVFTNTDRIDIEKEYGSTAIGRPWLMKIPKGVEAYARYVDLEEFKSCSWGDVYSCDFELVQSYYKGFKFKLASSPYLYSEIFTSPTISLNDGDVELPELDADGTYFVKGLPFNTEYSIKLNCKLKDDPTRVFEYVMPISTKNPDFTSWVSQGPSYRPFNVSVTQTKAHINLYKNKFPKDETVSIGDIGLRFNGQDYIYPDNGGIDVNGLKPATYFEFSPFADYNGVRFYFEPIRGWSTKKISVDIKAESITPTSVVIKGSYDAGDAEVADVMFTGQCGDVINLGDNVYSFGNLSPNKTYTLGFQVTDSYGQKFSASKTVTLPQLRLNTLQPRCVSERCAIVAAETNISDLETCAGFQWKKYDAPASLKPSEAYAAVYDGVLEGYIKNLQPTSYYNVRAFYKDADGNYYYGDWVTFDPSDFSYFEPTVHTYGAEEIGTDNAVLRGYVLQGSDDIISQGFQYWQSGDSNRAKSVADGMLTVSGAGQVMRVNVENLIPGTQYVFRSFVETAAGFTYGEEQTFATQGNSAVNAVCQDEEMPTVIGYYDMMGNCHECPTRGFNIVVYSDGTTRKLMVR